MLRQAVDRYIELKRACGYKFDDKVPVLRSFAAFAEAHGDRFVSCARVLDWASQGSSPLRCQIRRLAVRRFALAMRAEDVRHEVPAADALGRWRYQRCVPHIYTSEEISRLLGAAAQLPPAGSLRPLMYKTLFGLLAATGLRISEALALRIRDWTEDGLIIRETKCRKSRLVPLHESTAFALEDYLAVRTRIARAGDSFFITRRGQAPDITTVDWVFVKLARAIGLRKGPGRQGPRIHDLRHSFAVRSLEQCAHEREAVHRHMAALSTYLGHASPRDTYWYLEATPILLAQIAEAGEALYRRGAP